MGWRRRCVPVGEGSPSGRAPDKLSIIVFSGDFDRIHYALVLAAGAVAVNTAVTLFFTMGGCRALARAGADGTPGWAGLPIDPGPVGSGSGPVCRTAAERDAAFGAANLATVEELLAAAVALGVRFIVCEMGLKAIGLTAGDLREDVPVEIAGVATLLADASRDGSLLFV